MKRATLLTKFALVLIAALTTTATPIHAKDESSTKKEHTCAHLKDACTDDFMNMSYDGGYSDSSSGIYNQSSSSSSSSSEHQEERVFCQFPLYCDKASGTCIASNVETSCKKDEDCLERPDFYGTGLMYCDVNKCRTRYNVGDKCHRSSDCAGGMSCVNMRCVGRNENETCSEPLPYSEKFFSHITQYTCAKGLACVGGKCVKMGGLNSPCNEVPCGYGFTCAIVAAQSNSGSPNEVDKRCIRKHTVKIGMHCSVKNKNNINIIIFLHF